jgi:hypothetical protein
MAGEGDPAILAEADLRRIKELHRVLDRAGVPARILRPPAGRGT